MTARSGGDERMQWFAEHFDALAANVELAIKGKPEVIRLALVCLLSEGHLLIEDVPGVGKTSLARAIAASIDAEWHRIQFTPDLLPSDITGVTIYNQQTRDFEFHKGGIFANIVVGDEINRASPKTQSALLEVMEERQVTVDSVSHAAPRPFMVIATQNPIDMDGTYPLPEAQRDRFLMKTRVGYPDHDAETEVLRVQRHGTAVDDVQPVTTLNEVRAMITAANDVHVAPQIEDYIVRVTSATREADGIRLGASPRASLALMRAARAYCAAEGFAYVVPEAVKALAESVLAHRLILNPEAELDGLTSEEVIRSLLAVVEVPQDLTDAQIDAARREPGPSLSAGPKTVEGQAAQATGPSSSPGSTAPTGPAMVTALAGDGEAKVSWTPMAGDASLVTGYLIRKAPDDPGVRVSPDASDAMVGGLANGTRYTFTVRALGSDGHGPEVESNPVTPSSATPGPSGP